MSPEVYRTAETARGRIPIENQRSTAGFAESVSLAAVVDVGHRDVSGLIEAEENAPLADAQAIPAFQRTLQRLDVAVTVGGKRFEGIGRVRAERQAYRREAVSQT
jgi:hypothetical protein